MLNERKTNNGRKNERKHMKEKKEWKNNEHVRHTHFLKNQLWIYVDTENKEEGNGL